MTSDTLPDSPHYATAGNLLEALAARDFERIATTLTDDATLMALLPRGPAEWQGAGEIGAAFARWFGDTDQFDLVDATVGQIGPLLQLRWRIHVRATRFGSDAMVVEQHAYAKTTPSGAIHHMSLLCSGFWPERPEL